MCFICLCVYGPVCGLIQINMYVCNILCELCREFAELELCAYSSN